MILFLLATVLPAAAWAQSIESALSPGPLTSSHAKVEDQCSECHVRFDRAGQDGRCIVCHKDVGHDVRTRRGLHGRQPQQACRACHTDHRGRDMNIAPLDPETFDHQQTDYTLKGKHVGTACKSCHAPGKKYSAVPADCLACHRKDDKHKGTLGTACADCHLEQGWSETRVDHARTRFPLTGKHEGAKCESCHKTKIYNEAPLSCVGCHRQDDKHKARYGQKCETCHTTKLWSDVTFRHDTDTRFVLRGQHGKTRCDSCHTGHLTRDKIGSACIDCHRKDDKHRGSLGPDCVSCHTERNWTETAKFDHDKSRFRLRGGHVKVECKNCHTTPAFKDAPTDCLACHRKDDKHEGNLGQACADCHTERDWKASRFDHARTRFGLRGGHAVPPLKCSDCHADLRSYRSTAMACVSCHRKDDKHEGQLGERCANCHVEGGWRVTRFDHSRVNFALVGAHIGVACKSCHETTRYRDAPSDCVGCHRKDDKHEAALGTQCQSCHNARDWRLWTFNHDRGTDYPLQAPHARAACGACHVKPAPAGSTIAALDRSCLSCHHRDDIHDGDFGTRCERCHDVTRWKDVSNRAPGSRVRTGLPVSPVHRRTAS